MKYKIQIQIILAGMYFKYKYKCFEKYLNIFQILLCTIPKHLTVLTYTRFLSWILSIIKQVSLQYITSGAGMDLAVSGFFINI